jgi:predicted MPP superfamily phosphohydrolase
LTTAQSKTEAMRRLAKSAFKAALRVFGAQMWIDPAHLRVALYRPDIAAWPRDLPLRIAMLSDFHIGEPWLGLRALEDIVARTNALAPDIVLLLGDYEDGPRHSRPVAPALWGAALGKLKAPLGVHAVLGNHDYPREGKRRRLAAFKPPAQVALENHGIMVQVNHAIRLQWRGRAFWLAGLGDLVAEHADGRRLANLPATLARVTDDAPVLLMAHEPDSFVDVPERVALTISGHHHRGQIRLFGQAPVVPSSFGQRFLHGHIVENGRHLIVGSGLGHSGLPLRLDAPPEIVLIELGDQNAG